MSEPVPAPSTQTDVLMSLNDVTRRFGALRALDGVTFDIMRGEMLGVAGPNGAGKTTLLNVCTGVLPLSSGQVTFDGQNIRGMPPNRCCQIGIARTFQIPQIFSSMTVQENVATGAEFGIGQGGVGNIDDHVSEVIELVGLTPQREHSVADVDLLTRKRIMLAAALATRPKLLFLDEPLSGLNAEEVESFVALFQRLHGALDLTFVIVEHKVRALADLSERILILNFGEVLIIDTPERVLNDERVIDVYLGTRNLA